MLLFFCSLKIRKLLAFFCKNVFKLKMFETYFKFKLLNLSTYLSILSLVLLPSVKKSKHNI
jgi:hypothetical protein